MKKEFFALMIILVLIVGAVINVIHIRSLSADITGHIQQTQSCCRRADFDGATAALRKGLDHWLEADGYTHIFIRHSEIDSTSDAFYDVLSALNEEDADGAVSACEKLQYHIDSIVSMEHVTLRSVF